MGYDTLDLSQPISAHMLRNACFPDRIVTAYRLLFGDVPRLLTRDMLCELARHHAASGEAVIDWLSMSLPVKARWAFQDREVALLDKYNDALAHALADAMGLPVETP